MVEPQQGTPGSKATLDPTDKRCAPSPRATTSLQYTLFFTKVLYKCLEAPWERCNLHIGYQELQYRDISNIFDCRSGSKISLSRCMSFPSLNSGLQKEKRKTRKIRAPSPLAFPASTAYVSHCESSLRYSLLQMHEERLPHQNEVANPTLHFYWRVIILLEAPQSEALRRQL